MGSGSQQIAQEVGEQVVVTMPAMCAVQGKDQQIAALHMSQHGMADALTGERIARRSREAIRIGLLFDEAPNP